MLDEPRPVWQLDAACRGLDVVRFVPPSAPDRHSPPPITLDVVDVCARCPVSKVLEAAAGFAKGEG